MSAKFKTKNNALAQPLLLPDDDENDLVVTSKASDVELFGLQSLDDNQSYVASLPLQIGKKSNGNKSKPVRSNTYSKNNNRRGSNYFQQATLRHIGDFNSDQYRLTFSHRKINHLLGYMQDYDLKKGREFERQDFDHIDNEITHLESFKDLGKPARGLWKWFTCIMIGIMTGLCMAAVTTIVGLLQKWLWSLFRNALQSGFGTGYGVYLLFSFVCALIAGCCVLYGPRAAGSGIPEVKAYLNGSSIPTLFYFRTLVTKLVGVTCAVGGSFIIGKEGPMVHAGGAIASAIGRCGIWCKFEACFGFLFGTDKDKRDLISCGAAAGVSAAFGAPIGGMLFALEEVSSFWRPGLNWRAFFCSATSNFTVLAMIACFDNRCGQLKKDGLIDFIDDGDQKIGIFDMVNVIAFIFLGICGGLFGALFNAINTRLTKFRYRYLHVKWYGKLGEVLLMNIITVTVMMVLPYLYHECLESPCDQDSTDEICDNMVDYGQFLCETDGEYKYYNPMASLIQSPREQTIASLFYYQGTTNHPWFPSSALILAFFAYFCLGVVTYGISIPSGLFVPLILIGSTFGHFMGKYFNDLLTDHAFDVGTYSLLGAAALLGGATRMTISLTVILVEITDDVYYLLPIILTIMTAKWIGDRFNIALYDAHITLKGIPFLEPTLPKWFPTFVVAKDIMKEPVITLPRFCSMKKLLHVLSNRNFRHNAFPIVTNSGSCTDRNTINDDNQYDHLLVKSKKEREKDKRRTNPKLLKRASAFTMKSNNDNEYQTNRESHQCFLGLVLRSHIMAMLKNQCYERFNNLSEATRLSNLQLEQLTYDTRQLESLNDPRIDIEMILQQNEAEEKDGYFLDFTPYMHLSPFSVKENTPVLRVYDLFRGLGLRHLVVVNHENEVIGIITTHELTEHHLEHKVEHIVDDFKKNKLKYALQRMEFLRCTMDNDEYESYDPDNFGHLSGFRDSQDLSDNNDMMNDNQSHHSTQH